MLLHDVLIHICIHKHAFIYIILDNFARDALCHVIDLIVIRFSLHYNESKSKGSANNIELSNNSNYQVGRYLYRTANFIPYVHPDSFLTKFSALFVI